jgi:hypothetical protein
LRLDVRGGYRQIIMTTPNRSHYDGRRVVLVSAAAWAAAEELAKLTGSDPGEFIEAILLDTRERMATEAEPHEELPEGVIAISRARR